MKMTLMGCTDHLGGVTSAISTALMPNAHTSTCPAAFVYRSSRQASGSVFQYIVKVLVQLAGCAMALHADHKLQGCVTTSSLLPTAAHEIR